MLLHAFCSYGLYRFWLAAGGSQLTKMGTSLGGSGRSLWSKRNLTSQGRTLWTLQGVLLIGRGNGASLGRMGFCLLAGCFQAAPVYMVTGILGGFSAQPSQIMVYRGGGKASTPLTYSCCLAVSVPCQKLGGLPQIPAWSLFFLICLHELCLEMLVWLDTSRIRQCILPVFLG